MEWDIKNIQTTFQLRIDLPFFKGFIEDFPMIMID